MASQRKAVDTVDSASACLLRVEDIAQRLAVSRSMAWKLIAHGQIRSVRIGRAVRVRPQDLEDFLDDPERDR